MASADLLNSPTLRKSVPLRAGKEPCRVVAVGDTIISEQGLGAVIDRDPRYPVWGAAPTFEEANKVVWIPRTRPMHITGLR